MTEQELRERIAKRIVDSRCEVCNDCGAHISTDNPDEVADQILTLIKEASYVKLADDQSLPSIPNTEVLHIILQRDAALLKAGFRKVIL